MTDAAREAQRAYKKKWNEENAEHIREYHKKWRDSHPDKVKRYQAEYWERKAAQDPGQ